MTSLAQCIFLFLLLACNNARQTDKTLHENSDSLMEQGKFCNSSIGFDTASNTLHITVNIDTADQLKSIADYFSCIKTHVNNDKYLKGKFIENSKYIYFELHALTISAVNVELINYADTSTFWTGNTDGKPKSEEFFKFIVKSGYAKKWEQALAEIIGREYQWKYGAENIFYIRGSELSATQHKQYKKKIYPRSFELYMTRE